MKLFLYLAVFTSFSHAQQVYNNQVIFGGSYPIPANGNLERTWEGLYSLNGSYERCLASKVVLGIGLSYSRFQIDKDFLSSNNQGYFITPYFSVGYRLHLNEFLDVTPLLKFGNTWIRLHTKALSSDHKESGLSMEPSLRVRYFSYGNVGMNFTTSYKIIFEPIGDNEYEDAKTTRYFTFGLGLFYKW